MVIWGSNSINFHIHVPDHDYCTITNFNMEFEFKAQDSSYACTSVCTCDDFPITLSWLTVHSTTTHG